MYNPHAWLLVAYFATYLPTYRRPTTYKMDYKSETSYNSSWGSFTIENLTQFNLNKQHCSINMYIILDNPFVILNSNHWSPSYTWT